MVFLFKPSLPQRRIVSPAGRRGSDLPRPILIFIAAKENGFACRTGLLLHRFLISGGEFGNRCRFFPGNSLLRASILDFRPRLGNRCMVLLGNDLSSAVILDLRG